MALTKKKIDRSEKLYLRSPRRVSRLGTRQAADRGKFVAGRSGGPPMPRNPIFLIVSH